MGVKIVIVGAGISGLSLAHSLLEAGGFDVTVLESARRVGGKVWSDKSDGYICEAGVNGFLDNKPTTMELAGKLGLSAYRSSDDSRKRFIFSGGILNPLPESPPSFLKSGLVSIPGKLRLALEPLIPPASPDMEECLADFGRRRLGREAFEKLIDPMASGIFAGDPEKLSLRHCFPRINEIEQEYGSLIWGMVKLTARRRKSVGAGPGGTLTSFEGGLEDMVLALRESLGERIRLSAEAVSIEKFSSGNLSPRYGVHLADGTTIEAEAVAMACPAYRTSKIIEQLDKPAASALGRVYYPPLSVVSLGFRRQDMDIPLDAFGFLIPFKEGRKILGTLYDSSVFVNRAPEGKALLRVMTGGARAPEVAGLEDTKLISLVMSELKDITGLSADPEFVRIYRHEYAIPQYNLGHSDVLRCVEAMESGHPGVYVTGNAMRGVSLNDCILNSGRLAARIRAEHG